MKTFILHIDDAACWGCRTCEVACKQEMGAPEGVQLIAVQEDGPKMIDERPHFLFRVRVCRHCDDPPCVEACPVEAIRKRKDGIVVLETEECTGCRECIEACPYGAIAFDEAKGVARKCNLCHHRVDLGLCPACADNVCVGHCIYFGGPVEIERAVSEKHRTWSKSPEREAPGPRRFRLWG